MQKDKKSNDEKFKENNDNKNILEFTYYDFKEYQKKNYKYKAKVYNLYYRVDYLGRVYRNKITNSYISINNSNRTKNKSIVIELKIFI